MILHSAAERRPDVVEKEEEKTKNLNVIATQLLCDLASRLSIMKEKTKMSSMVYGIASYKLYFVLVTMKMLILFLLRSSL